MELAEHIRAARHHPSAPVVGIVRLSRVSTVDELARWLSDLSVGRLTELLEERGLPYVASGYGLPGLRTLRELAEHLLSDASVARALAELNTPQTQLVVAAAMLAQQVHGPFPARAGGGDQWPMVGAGGGWRYDTGAERAPDPAARAVPRVQVLDLLDLHGSARDAAEAMVRELADAVLVLPVAVRSPGHSSVVVPNLLHRQAARLAGLGRPIQELLSQAYQAAEVQRIHRGLALPTGPRTRDDRQRAIVDVFSQPERVRMLLAQAPTSARELLDKLAGSGPLLRTHCFGSRAGYPTGSGVFVFRPEGSGDPGTDWLAERGMVIPVGHDLAEVPYEVGQALRDPQTRPPYQPSPPPPPGQAVQPAPASAVRREARAAASVATARAELLLRHVDTQPLAIRKTGGLAVRDTRRAAKQAGLDEPQARFWLDLAANAGLLGVREPEPVATGRGRNRRPAAPAAPVLLLPTSFYDRWLATSPAQRLLPLITTWAVVPEVLTWWPAEDQNTPVALISPQDPAAVSLRRAVLEALAALPEDRGIGTPEALDWLVQVAAWHRPAVLTDSPELTERLTATLAEAHLLGLVAHGALTTIGYATLELLRAGAARYYPAIPGSGPSLRDHPRLATALGALQCELDALLPAPVGTARFQADLTAVVSGAPRAELADLLGSCADRESEGHAVVWRISPASIRRALDAGSDAHELLTGLGEISHDGRELPQPLVYLINDIARTHGRIRVVRCGCCIRSDDETLVLELSKTRTLTKIGLRRIAPTVLTSTADPDTVLTALRGAGYAPVLEAETGTTIVQRATRDRAAHKTPRLTDTLRSSGRNSVTAPALAQALLGSAHPEHSPGAS